MPLPMGWPTARRGGMIVLNASPRGNVPACTAWGVSPQMVHHFQSAGQRQGDNYDGVDSEILYVVERPQEIVSHCPRLADRGTSGSPGRASQTAHIIGRSAVQTYPARTTSLYDDLHPKLM